MTGTIRIQGRTVRICELHPGIYNAFAEGGERLAIVVRLSEGWWLGARIGGARRHFHLPEGGAEQATRALLDT